MNALFEFSLANLGGLFQGQGLLIFVVLLLFFGAKKLPELAKGLGQAIREFSKAKSDITDEITRPVATEETKQIATSPVQPAPGIESHATPVKENTTSDTNRTV